MTSAVLQSDPRWIEHRDAINAVRAGLRAPAGAYERYRNSLPGYVTLLAEQTPEHARIAMMQALIDGEHISFGVVAAGFRATTEESLRLRDRPPLRPVAVSELEALRTMPYRSYLRTAHWLAVRCEALRRAENRCQLCNRRDGLEVHHRTYERRGCERPSDVIVICSVCHSHHHQRSRGGIRT